MAELCEGSSHFKYLATVPYVKDNDPALRDDDCPICLEPFRLWQRNTETENRPVRLSCGHCYGLQCLARWMFSGDSNGCCCLCLRRIVVDPPRPQIWHPVLAGAITNLESLCLFQGQIDPEKKAELLRIFEMSLNLYWVDQSLCPELADRGRLVMLWEEALESMCNRFSEPVPVPALAPQPDERAPLLNQRVQIAAENRAAARFLSWDQVWRWLQIPEVYMGLFFFVCVTVGSAALWDPRPGSELALITGLLGYMVGMLVFIFRLLIIS